MVADKSPRNPTGEDQFNYLVERAKYSREFGNEGHEDRLTMLVMAEQAHKADDLGEIYEIIDCFYPRVPLQGRQSRKDTLFETQVRARFLNLVLGRMLKLIKAPKVLAQDLNSLLSDFPIEVAEQRARAQRELERDHHASIRAIAKRVTDQGKALNQSDLTQWIKAGLVIDPNEGKRANSVPRPRRAEKVST